MQAIAICHIIHNSIQSWANNSHPHFLCLSCKMYIYFTSHSATLPHIRWFGFRDYFTTISHPNTYVHYTYRFQLLSDTPSHPSTSHCCSHVIRHTKQHINKHCNQLNIHCTVKHFLTSLYVMFTFVMLCSRFQLNITFNIRFSSHYITANNTM